MPSDNSSLENRSTWRKSLLIGISSASATWLERYLVRPTAVEAVSLMGINESRLARALLITGNGTRFEPCILLAIREYRIADENIKRYQSAELPERTQLVYFVIGRFKTSRGVNVQ